MLSHVRIRSGSVLLVVLFISTIALVTFASFHDTVSSLLRIRTEQGSGWHTSVASRLSEIRWGGDMMSLTGGSLIEYSHAGSGSVLHLYSGSTVTLPLRSPGNLSLSILAGAPVRYIQSEWGVSVTGVIQTPKNLSWVSTPGSLTLTSLGGFSKLFLSDDRVLRAPGAHIGLFRDMVDTPISVRNIYLTY